jgi:Holliday junction resolvase-like predicted endonuclease
MYKNKEIGNKGEDLACQYLEQLGYDILKRNYFDKVGEIDIIAYKEPKIHFIEVKSVSRETYSGVIHETHPNVIRETHGGKKPSFTENSYYYNPAEKVDRLKVRKIEKVAERFLFENGLEEEAYQLDLIMIFIFDGGFRYKIEVIENININ